MTVVLRLKLDDLSTQLQEEIAVLKYISLAELIVFHLEQFASLLDNIALDKF